MEIKEQKLMLGPNLCFAKENLKKETEQSSKFSGAHPASSSVVTRFLLQE